MPDPTPQYYANWELVDYKVQFERRTKNVIVGGYGPVVSSVRQARPVLVKTYEAKLTDVDPSLAELPCPAYLAGTNYVQANPEGFASIGWGEGQWHISDIQYTKPLGEPMARKVRVTWEHFGVWFPYESDSDSQ